MIFLSCHKCQPCFSLHTLNKACCHSLEPRLSIWLHCFIRTVGSSHSSTPQVHPSFMSHKQKKLDLPQKPTKGIWILHYSAAKNRTITLLDIIVTSKLWERIAMLLKGGGLAQEGGASLPASWSQRDESSLRIHHFMVKSALQVGMRHSPYPAQLPSSPLLSS